MNGSRDEKGRKGTEKEEYHDINMKLLMKKSRKEREKRKKHNMKVSLPL